jgi:hypothetical protein
MDYLLNLSDSALFINSSERYIKGLIEKEKIQVCFRFCKELHGVTIEHPDSTIEQIGTIGNPSFMVPVNGILKSYLYNDKNFNSFEAHAVSVFEIYSQEFTHGPGNVLIKGHRLPVVDENSGLIKPGYKVNGFVDSIKIKSDDWLFDVNDLSGFLLAKKHAENHKTGTTEYLDLQAMKALVAKANAKSRNAIHIAEARRQWEIAKKEKTAKADFARGFSSALTREKGVTVTAKQIAERWLKGL